MKNNTKIGTVKRNYSMLEKLKTLFACMSITLLLGSVLALGLFMQPFYIVVAVVLYLAFIALLCYFLYKIWECYRLNIPISSQFMGNLYTDIMAMLLAVPAYAEDMQEELWWPLVTAVFWCSFADFVRQLLVVLPDEHSFLFSSANAGLSVTVSAQDNSSVKSRIKQGDSRQFKIRVSIVCVLVWSVLFSLFYAIGAFGSYIVEQVVWHLLLCLGCISTVCFGTHFKIEKQLVCIKKPFVILGFDRINIHDITQVVICNSFWGCCMKFYYGYGKKIVCYPACIEEIKRYLVCFHVDVVDLSEK